MNLIDLNDNEKLFSYAKTYAPDVSRVLVTSDEVSYYTNCETGANVNDVTMMEYDIEQFNSLKLNLAEMWKQTGLQEVDLLTNIISSVAIKNMPEKIVSSANKESYESISEDDAPTTYIYEF